MGNTLNLCISRDSGESTIALSCFISETRVILSLNLHFPNDFVEEKLCQIYETWEFKSFEICLKRFLGQWKGEKPSIFIVCTRCELTS